jgi:thiol:disulfide interchange protein DsbD
MGAITRRQTMSFLLLLAPLLFPAQQEVTLTDVHLEPAGPTGVELHVSLDVAFGYHIYAPDQNPDSGIPVSLTLGAGLEAAGDLRAVTEVVEHVEDFGPGMRYEYLWLAGSVELAMPVQLLVAADDLNSAVTLHFQACDESVCFPPDSAILPLVGPLAFAVGEQVAPEAADEAVPGIAVVETPTEPVQPQKTEPQVEGEASLLAFLLLAVAGGLFALMMPCTYPMIPITISFFTKQAEARDGNVLPLSLAYGGGIVAIFVAIGVIIGPVVLAFAVHPVTNIIIGLMFVVFALALFGAITLNPPQFLMRGASKASTKGGYIGVFLMGMTLVITSFTCTAPFVGSLLSFGATGGGLMRVALGMGVFGLTMAIPFVILSLVPGRLRSMPSSGEWMNTLKVTLGFVELAAALKFISNADLVWGWDVLSKELFYMLWGGIFLVTALFLFGMIYLKGYGSNDGIKPGRMLAGTGFLLFSLYNFHGYAGNDMDFVMTAIAPPYSSHAAADGTTLEKKTHTIVKDDYEAALGSAKVSGKLLLINFTGYT